MTTLEPGGIYHRQMMALAIALTEPSSEAAGSVIQSMRATLNGDAVTSPVIEEMAGSYEDGDVQAVMETVIDVLSSMLEKRERALIEEHISGLGFEQKH